MDCIEFKIKKLTGSLSSDEAEYDARKREGVLGIGETVICIFMGRKRTTGITTTSRRRRITTKVKHDIYETKREIEDLNKDFQELERELREQVNDITETWGKSEENLQEYVVTPRKSDVNVDKLRIIWVPNHIFKYFETDSSLKKVYLPY